MSTLAITRQRAVTWLREHLRIDGMSRADAARWASCRDMADLGEMVIAWLGGEVAQTPGHCGPPCAETIPLIPVLTAVNRAGFVTDNSQRADGRDGRTWKTWVIGFADDAAVAALRAAADGAGLVFNACRDPEHQCSEQPWGWPHCPRDDATGFWADACPAVAGWLWDSWWVYIEDPEDGRNDRLWPALEAFADGQSCPYAICHHNHPEPGWGQ